jgi:hypothetical protein
MEEIINFFLDLLQVTGEDLAPEKCVSYLISQRLKDGKPRILQKHSSHCRIKIVSRSTNTESGVKWKAPNEGHRTLGFFMTGDGKCSAHKKVMTEKASLYATDIQSSSIWKGESGLAYNSFYLPLLGYGTPETTLLIKNATTSKSQLPMPSCRVWGLAGKLTGASSLVRLNLAD